MADKIVVMRNGNIEQFGSPLEVFDRPNNVFVAGFIGSPPMNLIEARVSDVNGQRTIQSVDGISLPWNGRAALHDGQRVIYGIRPGDLRITEGSGMVATIDVLEQTGSETLVFAQAGASTLCATFAERQDFSRGQRIHLSPTPDRVHLFDAESGLNLT